MSNSIFNLDPTTHQASLSKVNLGASDDASLIVLGKVTKVYYHQGTLDFKLTSGVSSIVADGSGNGTGSARIPLDYFGQDSEGRTYGHYRPVQIGDTVAIAYLNGHKTSPIVIGVYAPNGEQYEAISPTLFDSGDDKDNYIAETGLAEQHVHHSGQISYRSGSGRLFESLNGYSFMVIDDDTSQDYSELYTDLSLVPYSSIDGKTHDPQREKAGDWLLVHEDNPNGLDADNHITRFYVNKAGDFELVFTNTSFAGVSTVLHMDKNGMQLNKYIGHQRKKAGLPRASEEDQTYTADFDSAPTTVTFDLGKTKDDTISLKSSTTVDSKEQATNLEVRTDGVYINDVKLFDSNSNSLSALNMFLDGGVMDFSKITVKNLSGDNIEDGTIDGTKLKDKTVTADKLNISKLSDISPDMGTITAGSILVNNGTAGSTGVKISGDASSDPDILTPHDKAQLQQQLNALYSQCQALMDYGTTVGIDISELKTNENSLKNLTDWIFETEGNVKVDRVKIDEAITNFTGLLETYRSKFTSQLNQKIGETSNKANSIFQGSQAPDQAESKEGDLWLQTNSDGTSNIMQYNDGVWQEANLKGYQDAKKAAEQAQETADKLPHNYYQATEPSGTQYNDGDLWYQSVSSTSDGKIKYNIYKWDISSKRWVQLIDNNANANYVASSAPADPSEGDFWTDTDGTLHQYKSGTWVTVPTQGPQGVPGIPGAPGKDGQTTYFHIAYANSADGSVGFTNTPGNNSYNYFGTYTDYTLTSSKDPTKYTWVKMFDSSKKRNFTTTPTTPYDVGDTWITSGSTYFCKTARPSGAFSQSDWVLQQLTIQSLDSDLQANINGDKNLLMVDDVTYYSNPVLDSTSMYTGDYPFDYTSIDTTYTFQVQAKSTVSGDYVHMYPAWGYRYSQSQNKTTQVSVTTSPSVPKQTSTFTSTDSETKLALTTDWVTYTCTVSGTWGKGSVLTALLGRVFNSETKGTVSFRHIKLVAGNSIKDYTSDDSITVAQGSNYWDLNTLQKSSFGSSNLVYYTPWYPISEGQRVFLTHYDYPSYPGITTNASVEFADSDHNFISNGTNNSQGSSTLDGNNSTFIAPQSLGGVYYNERMLNISIVSQAAALNYQDLYIQTSGLLQSKLAVSGRGVTLATFDPYSGQRVDTQYWDTYGTVDNVNALVSYLKSISSQDLVVAIATKDALINPYTDSQLAAQNLCTLLQSYGLPSSYAPADLQWRVSFAFVGHTPAYQGSNNETLVSSSKGDGQVSTLTAYVSNGHISSTNNTRLVAYANAPAKTAYFRAGYSFSTDEVNRANFMVTVDKLSTNYSPNIADVSSNAVRKNVAYKGVTLNDNGLTATAGDTQVIVNSSNGFEIKKSGTNVFSVDTNGNLIITGSTISTSNISGVNFQGDNLTLSGTLSVDGFIVGANGSFIIDQKGMEVSPMGGGSVTISQGGLTIQGSSVGNQSTAGTYGSNDSLAGDAGLFATKDKYGNTKTWITSSGTLIAQDAVIHGNVSVANLTLTKPSSKVMFGSGFTIDGNGQMTVTSPSQISNGTYSDGVIEGSELDIGTAYHSMLSNGDKYRYHVSNIGETTFGMSQDLGLMSSTQGINESYLSLTNAWTQGQINFRGSGQAPTNAIRSLVMTSDIYTDSYGWKHRFSAPANGVNDTYNYIPIWNKEAQGSINQYTINYNITDPITSSVNQSVNSSGSNGWGGSDTLNWTLSTVEFPSLGGSLFRFGSAMDLYPAQNQTIKLYKGQTYVFGAYIWHCGLHGGAKITIVISSSDNHLQNSQYAHGNIVGYQQSGYSLVAYTPSSDVFLLSFCVEAGTHGSTQGYDYGVPLSVTDPFAVPLNQFTSKLLGGGLDTLTSLGGRFGMPYPHLDASQHGVLGIMRADNLTAGDKVVVSIPINYESGSMANFPQINLGLAKPGNDDNYSQLGGLEFQPLMPGYYTYDFYFVWKDEYKNYINNNMVQLNLISNGIGSGEKAYVVSVDSVRMGIFVGTDTTSSTRYLNEYQTKFSPLGSLQLSHISNAGENGYTIAGQTQLTSEGLTINSAFSTTGNDRGGMHISINGKSGISISGSMNFRNPEAQPTLSFYGYVPYNTLLEHTIEPTYKSRWDAQNSASGIWFDSYGNVHGYDSSVTWNIQSSSSNSKFTVPLSDGNSYRFNLSRPDGQPGDNPLKIGLVHFNKFGGGYVSGNYPAIYSGSGDSLAGIAFGAGYVIIFGNGGNKRNNLWSFPQDTYDGHSSDSGSVDEISNTN